MFPRVATPATCYGLRFAFEPNALWLNYFRSTNVSATACLSSGGILVSGLTVQYYSINTTRLNHYVFKGAFGDCYTFQIPRFYFTENEHLLSGQLDKLATDIAVLVFETDEIPCRDIVRLVELLS